MTSNLRDMDDTFFVQFIWNSLTLEYKPFQINYNNIKNKWDVSEMSNMLTQEELRLKKQGGHFINLWVKELVNDLK